MKRFAFVFIAALLCFSGADARILKGSQAQTFLAGWNTLQAGAGGYLRGQDIQCNNGFLACSTGVGSTTAVIRADTYGAYVLSPTAACSASVPAPCWRELLSTATMPAGTFTQVTAQGVYEIGIAPSNTNIAYMMFNGQMFKTTNLQSCAAVSTCTWTLLTGFTQISGIGANGGNAGFGRFIAISPATPNVVYVGTPANGVWRSLDGGATWAQVSISLMPVGSSGTGDGNLLYFDTSDATGNTLYEESYGTGVTKCTGAGGTLSCTPQTGTGFQINARHMVVCTNGAVWLTTDSQSNNVYRIVSGVWTFMGSAGGSNMWSATCDPNNNAHVTVADESGAVNVTNNGNATTPTWLGTQSYANNNNRTATDIPWLQVTNEQSMTNGDMQIDPVSGKIGFAEGIGYWQAPAPTTAVAPAWVSVSAGIEQLVAIQVLNPPGCNAFILGSWDRPAFYQPNPNKYPTTVKPAYNTNSIIAGWGLDYASSNPSVIVGYFNFNGTDQSGVSTDCGQTWTKWTTPVPNNFNGGAVAASTATDWIVCVITNGNCMFTVDGAASWHLIDNSIIPNLGVYQTINTNATTASGNCVLHFANVPTNIRVGDPVFDKTSFSAINSGSNSHVASFVSGASGTVTLQSGQCATGSGVGSGDVIQFNPETGWGFNDFFSRQIAAADRVTTDVISLYNYCNGSSSCTQNLAGIWKCTINHAAVSIACSHTEVGGLGSTDNANSKLMAMPGVTGELFFSSDITSPSSLQMCTSFGASCAAVTSGGNPFTNVGSIGFGKQFAGTSFASIIVSAQLNGVQGVYISKDNASTWSLIDSSVPLGNPSGQFSIACDGLTPMNCGFVQGSGSGWSYYGGIN